MFVEIILAVLLGLAFLSHFSNRHRRNAVKNIPGPFCVPAIGVIHLFFSLNPKNLLDQNVIAIAKYGNVARYWAFHRLIIFSADVELNEQLLASSQHIVKHPLYKVLGMWLANGLLISDGKKWHQRRKITTPAFHFKILEKFVEVFDRQTTICLKRLASQADEKTPFDVYPYICSAALDIIAETSMGTKVYAQSAKSTDYANAVNELTTILANRFLSVHLNVEWIFTLLCPLLKLRQTKLIRILHNFTINVIEKRRNELISTRSETATESQPDNEDFDLGTKKRMALLDVLLQATVDGEPLTNEEIREEVDTFMFEGHDTTTSAISHALYLLSRHERVQEKLREEVLEVLGDDRAKSITMRELSELKYLECIIKETLRLYPSVPLIARKIEEDFTYTHSKYGNGVIPAGSEFVMVIRGQNIDPKSFKDPTKFIPERHENNEISGAFAMIPFSAGPRNCIGQKFAMLEMKTMLAKIVRAFYLLPLGEEIKPEVNIVLRSGTGFQMGLKKRLSLFDVDNFI